MTISKQSVKDKSKRILFLEDEDILAELYCKKLKKAGYDVKLCDNPDELISIQEKFDADLALLDHGLKGTDKSGMDMIPILKSMKPSMVIAMLSNYSEFQMKDAAKKAGAKDYLLKINTSPTQLVQYVDQVFLSQM